MVGEFTHHQVWEVVDSQWVADAMFFWGWQTEWLGQWSDGPFGGDKIFCAGEGGESEDMEPVVLLDRQSFGQLL